MRAQEEMQCNTSANSASSAIPNCKAPKTPHYSLVQRADRATRWPTFLNSTLKIKIIGEKTKKTNDLHNIIQVL